ncbi:MAG: DivIVA domain-containing protein [Cyanobacteria bacterium P01_A01_bin.45]
MLHPQSFNTEQSRNGKKPPSSNSGNGNSQGSPQKPGIDVQQELNRIEEIILASPRIPLTKRTLVDEEKLLEQLDYVRVSLPDAFAEAIALLKQQQEILLQAEEYGQQIVDAAQSKRAQILSESDIIRQAEHEAEQLRRKVKQECDAMMEDTLTQLERQRRACQQDLEETRRQAMVEAEEIAQGADEYADGVLESVEQQLYESQQRFTEMLHIVSNGRQQLFAKSPVQKNKSLPSKKK